MPFSQPRAIHFKARHVFFRSSVAFPESKPTSYFSSRLELLIVLFESLDKLEVWLLCQILEGTVFQVVLFGLSNSDSFFGVQTIWFTIELL